MRLSREEVEHIALLSRVGLGEEEIEKLRQQLSNILENFEILEQVDTGQVDPTAQAVVLENVFRPDEPAPSLPREDILANAPHQESGSFRVRAVLE
ncbi:MAG: Asp-tRNA(Asn)/Glu-tRNA(Gln) amidotransferase subunit GatC [Dehalococcoidia bacterium]